MTSSVSPKANNIEAAGAVGESCFPVEEQAEATSVRGEGQDEDHHGAEDSGEAKMSRAARQPRMPSLQERQEHDALPVQELVRTLRPRARERVWPQYVRGN